MPEDLAQLYADRLALLKQMYAPLIAIGRHCQECAMLVGYGAGKGKPVTCDICKAMPNERPAKPASPSPWKVRRRTWNNGREYWVVAKGSRIHCGPNGGEACFYSRAEAIARANHLGEIDA